MNTASPCSICDEWTHAASRCPELIKATPGGGGGGHSHDDDDERVQTCGLGDRPFIEPPVSGGQAIPS